MTKEIINWDNQNTLYQVLGKWSEIIGNGLMPIPRGSIVWEAIDNRPYLFRLLNSPLVDPSTDDGTNWEPFGASQIITRDIWAEENGALTQGSHEWSFGNGATGYIGLPVGTGWMLESMYFHADVFNGAGSIEVELKDIRNLASVAAPTIESITLTGPSDGGGSPNNASKLEEFTPGTVTIPPNAVLSFRTVLKAGNVTDARVGCTIYKVINNLSSRFNY